MAGVFRRGWWPPQKKRFSPFVSTASFEADPGAGVVTITGFAPAVVGGTAATASPGKGVVTITGFAPTFGSGTGYAGAPGHGSLVITGHAPVVTSQPPAMTPGKGSVVITGLAPTVTGMAGATLTPGLGRITISGFRPEVSGSLPTTGGAADPRRKWLDWKARQKRKPVKVEVRPADAIPPGTLSFMELLSFLDAERQAQMNRPALGPEEQALDDADVERLLMEEA